MFVSLNEFLFSPTIATIIGTGAAPFVTVEALQGLVLVDGDVDDPLWLNEG